MTIDPEILKRLDGLSEKLGTASQKVWTVFIHQAHVEAAVDAFWIVLATAGLYLSYRGLRLSIGKAEQKDSWMAGVIICGIGIIVLTIVLGTNLAAIATPLINPEYWALQQILWLLK